MHHAPHSVGTAHTSGRREVAANGTQRISALRETTGEAVTEWNEDFGTVALVVAVGVLAGILKDALKACREDRPWFGWDLRRLRRWPPEDPGRPS
jgi:hypothetical protein